MIYEFIYNKSLIDLRKHFTVNPNDFPHIKTKKEYKELKKINERKNRKKKGVLVARLIIIDNVQTVCIGWSLCKLKTKKRPKGDIFNETRGYQIASNRAKNYGKDQLLMLHNIPPSIKKQLERFIERSRKYFHVDDQQVVFSPWINTFVYNSILTEDDITNSMISFPNIPKSQNEDCPEDDISNEDFDNFE